MPNLFNTRSLAVSFPFGCQMPVCSPLFTYQSRFKMNKPIYLKILYNNVLLYDKFIRLKSNASRKSWFINVCLKKINIILKTTLPPFIYSLLLISSICKLKISYWLYYKLRIQSSIMIQRSYHKYFFKKLIYQNFKSSLCKY